jgi:hypothetical protein
MFASRARRCSTSYSTRGKRGVTRTAVAVALGCGLVAGCGSSGPRRTTHEDAALARAEQTIKKAIEEHHGSLTVTPRHKSFKVKIPTNPLEAATEGRRMPQHVKAVVRFKARLK